MTGGGGGGVAAHNILSATHLDSVPAAPVQGDLIVASAAPAWARLPRGAAGQALIMNPAGTDPIWAAPGAGFDPLDQTRFWYYNDFLGRTYVAESFLSWYSTPIGTGVFAIVEGTWPHFGVVRGTTGAVLGNGCYWTSGDNISLATFVFPGLGANSNWENKWVFRLEETTNVRVYIGFVHDGSSPPTTINNWFGLRYDTTLGDVNFRLITCNGGAITNLDSGIAADVNWHRLQIRSLLAGTLRLSVDAGAEQVTVLNVYVGSTDAFATVVTNAAVIKHLNIDLFSFLATGLAR
jgi:hypothetical protein